MHSMPYNMSHSSGIVTAAAGAVVLLLNSSALTAFFAAKKCVPQRISRMHLQSAAHALHHTCEPASCLTRPHVCSGHELEFVMAPNLHWPDTMFSFDSSTGVLYTCDAFGLHYCDSEPFDTDLNAIAPHFRFYYDCLMKPNARSVLSALKRTKAMDYSTIAVGHGPLLRYNLSELVGRYQSWSEAVGKATASVAVLYSSDYGYSDRLSQTLARGITKAGAATEMVDVLSIDPQVASAAVGKVYNGFCLLNHPARNCQAYSCRLCNGCVPHLSHNMLQLRNCSFPKPCVCLCMFVCGCVRACVWVCVCACARLSVWLCLVSMCCN